MPTRPAPWPPRSIQIKAYVYDQLRASIPRITLDNVFISG